MKFHGIYTPVITPHDDQGRIEESAYLAQIDHLIEAGVHGIIVGGSTGEYYAQSIDERIRMARVSHQHIAGRVPLIVGTGAMRLPDSLEVAQVANEIQVDAILISTPPYSVPTERENALNALAIDRVANRPVMLYNYPGRMGVNMGEEFLDRVGRSKNFCAIKESSGDINRVHLLARDYPHIQMSCGMDDQALEFFAWGAKSWVCGGSNFLPEEHITLYQACVVEGNFEKGRRIMSAMMPLMHLLEQGGKFIQTIKYGVELEGRRAGPPRPPLKPLKKDDKRALEQVVHVLKTTIARIEAES
ncbi:MAG: dihydrodipicolinate synthase family protein [Gammaproteobacteria bacterium]